MIYIEINTTTVVDGRKIKAVEYTGSDSNKCEFCTFGTPIRSFSGRIDCYECSQVAIVRGRIIGTNYCASKDREDGKNVVYKKLIPKK